jgi:hypothetical protein
LTGALVGGGAGAVVAAGCAAGAAGWQAAIAGTSKNTAESIESTRAIYVKAPASSVWL